MTKKKIILWAAIIISILSFIELRNYYFEKQLKEIREIHAAYKNTSPDTMLNCLDDKLKYSHSRHLKSIVEGYMYLIDGDTEEADKQFNTATNFKNYMPREMQLQKYDLIIDTLIHDKNYEQAVKYIGKAFKYMNIYDFNNRSTLVWDIISKLSAVPDGTPILREYMNEILETKRLDINSKVFFLRKMEVLCILEIDYIQAIEYIVNILNAQNFVDEAYYKGKVMVDLSIIVHNLGSSELSIQILNEINTEKIPDPLKQADLEIYKLINLTQNKQKLGRSEEALADLQKVVSHTSKLPSSKLKEMEFLISVKEAEIYIATGNYDKGREILSTLHTENSMDNIYSYSTSYADYLLAFGDLFIASGNYENARAIYDYIIDNDIIGIDYIDWTNVLTNLALIEENLGNYQESEKLKAKLKEVESTWESFKVKMLYQYVNSSEDSKIIRASNAKMKVINSIYFFALIIAFLIILKTLILPKYKIKRKRKIVTKNMEKNNYFLVYQPIINPKTKEISGVETLLRLNDKDSILTPNIFMKDIETAELIDKIVLWQLKEIKKNYTEIQLLQNKTNTFYISINLSLNEIKNRAFIESLKEEGADLISQGASICLEITENVGLVEEDLIRLHIKDLINAGYKIAIDDFGIEYSNISLLDQFDFHTLKLDKYFIDNLKDSVVVQNLFKVVNEISKDLNISIVVEGVEKQWQLDILMLYESCNFSIQGYYYSKPLEIHNLKNFKVK